jgi:hypothetical protein
MSAAPEPLDPFSGDPDDPVRELAALDEVLDDGGLDAAPEPPLSPQDREDVLEDLADLEVFEALLEPRGIKGLIVHCGGCDEAHYFAWDLLRGNLRHLLSSGRPRVHEPAYDPDPDHYVTWEYARGYADGVHDTLTEGTDEPS